MISNISTKEDIDKFCKIAGSNIELIFTKVACTNPFDREYKDSHSTVWKVADVYMFGKMVLPKELKFSTESEKNRLLDNLMVEVVLYNFGQEYIHLAPKYSEVN